VRSYRNPFRYRTSEQESQQGLRRFLKTFGAGALDLLPEEVWDRPVIIQSAPGAGKTSLLRTFSADSLREIAARRDEHPVLHERMVDLGAIEGGEVRLLGVRLALGREYLTINDLRLDQERAVKVFLRLLDINLVRAVVEALRVIVGTGAVDEVRLATEGTAAEALARIGGPEVGGMAAWSKVAYREMLDQLDSVLPPPLEEVQGHHASYAIGGLSGAEFWMEGRKLPLRPLVMFDDAQELGPHQRQALLETLANRELVLHRWLAERYQALSADEVIAGEPPERAFTPVQIEAAARRLGEKRRRGRTTKGFERLLLEIGDLRAMSALRSDADEERRFHELLDVSVEADDPRLVRAVGKLDERLEEAAAGNPRYGEWLQIAGAEPGYSGAVQRRLVEILITRDRARGQDTLFTVPLSARELRERSASGLGEAAALFLRHELALPFYWGPERLARLASENIEQYINISGGIFEEMLARITLEQPHLIEPVRQDAIVTQTSEAFWREIPRRLPEGRRIQRLLLHVASLCRAETYRPTAPYPPGATATAISMRDRERLLNPAWRAENEGAEELFATLASALGHNLLRADLDYSVKNERWMVLYLNRLLCARFGLALGLGGIRERPVEELCAWMVHGGPAEEEVVEPGIQERLAV
jgi:hypothetical protein